MTVLANVDTILIRATYCNDMIATYISDVSLDTAEEMLGENSRATQVEACRCPLGYTGTSCESCVPGYYRNFNDRSVSILGSCSSCPCNGNEQSCELDYSGHVTCHCHRQYTGQYCQDLGKNIKDNFISYILMKIKYLIYYKNIHYDSKIFFENFIADYIQSPSTVSPTSTRPTPIAVMITEPKIRIVKIGDSIQYHCSAKSSYNVSINFFF